jgi:peptidoglycan hydrolase-like protein with peptidoglycan-binding domain
MSRDDLTRRFHVSSEEIEQADRFFEDMVGGSSEEMDQSEAFFADMMGLSRTPAILQPQRSSPSWVTVSAARDPGQDEADDEAYEAYEAHDEQQTPSSTHQVPVGRTMQLSATGSVSGGTYSWTSTPAGVVTVTRIGTPQQHPSRADVTGVTAGTATVTVTYQPASGTPSISTFTVQVTAATITAVNRYGCHDLRRNDKDSDPGNSNRPRWGGTAGAPATRCTPGTPPTNPQHVRQLQDDLRSLGFLIVGTPSGNFDRNTEWAVREFQIYAKMDLVARVKTGVAVQGAHIVAAANGHDTATNLSEYVASLESTGNTAPYAGPISGVVNAGTRAALDHWLRNNWRCPVVIEAWTVTRGRRTAPAATNLWAHDSHASSAPRMYARDFTNYYTFPVTRNADDMHVIGDYVTYLSWSGPRSVPPSHTWNPEGEILPAALVGTASPTGSTLSTYRVVRAVSEVECIGFFDSINCYDNAFLSAGPGHWTLGIVQTSSVDEGELCGYLAYLRHVDPAAFRQAFEFFGMRIDENWVTAAGVANGADLFSASQRKYTGWMALQQENGTFTRMARTEADGNYFKSWHWHYRFVMAGRTIQGYRQRMWDMTRIRLRDILNVAWGTGVAQVGTGTSARPAKLGDVFTSERAIAMLLRFHIRFPGYVISGGGPASRLRDALTRAKAADPTASWTADPSTWTNAMEGHLVQGIFDAAPTSVQGTLTEVRNWPTWLTGSNPRGFSLTAPVAAALSANRNSFSFDTAGLPPAPP